MARTRLALMGTRVCLQCGPYSQRVVRRYWKHPSQSTSEWFNQTSDEPNIGQVDIKEFEGLLAHAPARFWHVEKTGRDLQEKMSDDGKLMIHSNAQLSCGREQCGHS
jgi:hypothetical protein